LQQSLEACPLLRVLVLYENRLTRLPPLNNPMLQELWMNGNRVASLHGHTPPSSSATNDGDAGDGWCPLVGHLHLHDNSISSLGCLRMFPLVTALTLSFNQVCGVLNVLLAKGFVTCTHVLLVTSGG